MYEQRGINRNILECKVRRQIRWRQTMSVLIETYWNVKTGKLVVQDPYGKVLIETYWNVKAVEVHFSLQNTGY